MKSSKKRSSHHKAKHTEEIPLESKLQKSKCEIDFGEYIGNTVTVYVNAGGLAGNGITGVLLGQADTYIRLLVLPSTPPSCSAGNACNGNTGNILFCLFCPFNDNSTLGSMAEISIMSIVAFAHNNNNTNSRY